MIRGLQKIEFFARKKRKEERVRFNGFLKSCKFRSNLAPLVNCCLWAAGRNRTSATVSVAATVGCIYGRLNYELCAPNLLRLQWNSSCPLVFEINFAFISGRLRIHEGGCKFIFESFSRVPLKLLSSSWHFLCASKRDADRELLYLVESATKTISSRWSSYRISWRS